MMIGDPMSPTKLLFSSNGIAPSILMHVI
jgi:hypothetical protein